MPATEPMEVAQDKPRRTGRWALLAGGLLLVVALAVFVFPASEPGDPFFTSDFEGGNLSPFHDVQADSDDRVQVVTSPDAFSGGRSARFEVQPGDEAAGGNRAELTGPAFSEGETVWFRQAIRVDESSAVDGGWQQVVQYSANGEGSPALALRTVPEDDGRFSFELAPGEGPEVYWRSPVLERDTWYDVGVRVRFSSEDGEVSVYFGGDQQTLENSEETISASTIDFGEAYFKTGIYRSDEHDETSLVYHDKILMGHSATDVGL